MTTLPSTKIVLRREDLARLGINISNSTMLRLEAAGRFPKRIRIGDQSVAWLANEVIAHLERLGVADAICLVGHR